MWKLRLGFNLVPEANPHPMVPSLQHTARTLGLEHDYQAIHD